ncbi:MAG: thioredoxin fold domain-containing protein [Bacteroidetes bacterium]|nr:thioredoxin fold domain-containing protein [Bacteroidota bacterium]MBT7492521.1 thioredoxin fold domain-containing protein [Bacteroidota bacterium]
MKTKYLILFLFILNNNFSYADIEYIPIYDKVIDFSSYAQKGKISLFVISNHWCAPCDRMKEDLRNANYDMKKVDLFFLMMSKDAKDKKYKNRNSTKQWGYMEGVTMFPTSFLYGPSTNQIYRYTGYKFEKIDADIKLLLKNMKTYYYEEVTYSLTETSDFGSEEMEILRERNLELEDIISQNEDSNTNYEDINNLKKRISELEDKIEKLNNSNEIDDINKTLVEIQTKLETPIPTYQLPPDYKSFSQRIDSHDLLLKQLDDSLTNYINKKLFYSSNKTNNDQIYGSIKTNSKNISVIEEIIDSIPTDYNKAYAKLCPKYSKPINASQTFKNNFIKSHDFGLDFLVCHKNYNWGIGMNYRILSHNYYFGLDNFSLQKEDEKNYLCYSDSLTNIQNSMNYLYINGIFEYLVIDNLKFGVELSYLPFFDMIYQKKQIEATNAVSDNILKGKVNNNIEMFNSDLNNISKTYDLLNKFNCSIYAKATFKKIDIFAKYQFTNTFKKNELFDISDNNVNFTTFSVGVAYNFSFIKDFSSEKPKTTDTN